MQANSSYPPTPLEQKPNWRAANCTPTLLFAAQARIAMCRGPRRKERRIESGPTSLRAKASDALQGLKCLRENSWKSSFVRGAQFIPTDSRRPYRAPGLIFRTFPRIASEPSSRTPSWAIIFRSLRELLPLRGSEVSGTHADTKAH